MIWINLISIFIHLNLFANDELDKLALSSLLLKNGNLSRAQSVLASIKDPNDVQTERYYILMGILSLKQKRFSQAIKNLGDAKKNDIDKKDLPEFYELLSRAYLGHKDYQFAEKTLSENKTLLMSRLGYYQLLAKLLFETQRSEEGWHVLHQGLERFPLSVQLKKQKWFYLFNNGLFQTSKSYLFNIIHQHTFSALELGKLAYQYRVKKQLDTAIKLGELARLIDPNHEEVIKELARAYIEKHNIMAAAQIFEGLAYRDPSFLSEASELWRKAGYPKHSERIAIKIRDPEKSLKQKITLALQSKDYSRVTQLGVFGQRSKLKGDEDILYTLAYSHFMLGDYDKVEFYLKNVTRKDLFKKATSLRESIVVCSKKPGACL
jgi:tetratricopeptide (TPR) repeat protein